MRISELLDQQILAVSKELSNRVIDNDARNVVRENIQFLKKIGSYRGQRHMFGFPVNGQNTKNNARTAKKLNKLMRRG